MGVKLNFWTSMKSPIFDANTIVTLTHGNDEELTHKQKSDNRLFLSEQPFFLGWNWGQHHWHVFHSGWLVILWYTGKLPITHYQWSGKKTKKETKDELNSGEQVQSRTRYTQNNEQFALWMTLTVSKLQSCDCTEPHKGENKLNRCCQV